MATFTLTCIGDDRPGLVSELSAPIRAHGASWSRSQMARLGGKFAGILLLDVPAAVAVSAGSAGRYRSIEIGPNTVSSNSSVGSARRTAHGAVSD